MIFRSSTCTSFWKSRPKFDIPAIRVCCWFQYLQCNRMYTIHPNLDSFNYRPQRSCEGYVFTRVCLSTGGTRYTPRTRCTPQTRFLPWTRYTPQTRFLPWTRYTPRDQVPPDQVHPAWTRYIPQDQVHPPPTATVADGTHPTGRHSCYCKSSSDINQAGEPSVDNSYLIFSTRINQP